MAHGAVCEGRLGMKFPEWNARIGVDWGSGNFICGGRLRGRTVRCVCARAKVGSFPPPVATGPRVLNAAPMMLF